MPGGDSPKFLVGDVVKCVPGNGSRKTFESTGWILGKEFEVSHTYCELSTGSIVCFPAKGNGVWEEHLELVSRDGVRRRHPEEGVYRIMRQPKFKVGDRIQPTEEARRQEWCDFYTPQADIRIEIITPDDPTFNYYVKIDGESTGWYVPEMWWESYRVSNEDQCIGL